MTTPNAPTQNNRYQNADSSSIYNIKNNVNSFLNDFASIDFTNLVDNNLFNNIDISGNLLHWSGYSIPNLIGKYDTTNNNLKISLGASGNITQNISTKLLRNTNYTLVFYGSTSVSGALKISIASPTNYQIFNLSITSEVNSASTLINYAGLGIVQKHIINFKTTGTSAVSSDIVLKIENLTSGTVSGVFQNVMIYSSLIELGNLPASKELAVQSNIIPGTPYDTTIYDATGVAVSGTYYQSTSCITDQFVNVNFQFCVYNGDYFIKELPSTTKVTPVNIRGLKVQADNGDVYYVTTMYGNIQLVKTNEAPPASPLLIPDILSGHCYTLHISVAGLNTALYTQTTSTFLPSPYIFSGVTSAGVPNGNKYTVCASGTMPVSGNRDMTYPKNLGYSITVVDSRCVEDVTVPKLLRDSEPPSNLTTNPLSAYNGKCYNLVGIYNGSILVSTATQFSTTIQTYDLPFIASSDTLTAYVPIYKNYSLMVTQGVVSLTHASDISPEYNNDLISNLRYSLGVTNYNDDTTPVPPIKNSAGMILAQPGSGAGINIKGIDGDGNTRNANIYLQEDTWGVAHSDGTSQLVIQTSGAGRYGSDNLIDLISVNSAGTRNYNGVTINGLPIFNQGNCYNNMPVSGVGYQVFLGGLVMFWGTINATIDSLPIIFPLTITRLLSFTVSPFNVGSSPSVGVITAAYDAPSKIVTLNGDGYVFIGASWIALATLPT